MLCSFENGIYTYNVEKKKKEIAYALVLLGLTIDHIVLQAITM